MGTATVQTWISAFVLALGLALMAYMIYAESEPGAIPLALVLVGTIWLVVTRVRVRRARNSR
jgi:hypothetical protein